MKNLSNKVSFSLLASSVVLAVMLGTIVTLVKGMELRVESTPAVQSTTSLEVIHVRRHQLLLPLEDLVANEKAIIAIVEPIERKKVVVVAKEELGSMKAIEKERMKDIDDYPFTPIDVKAVEILKGNLPEEFELWEERGEIVGFKVESDDPFLSPGVRGLLVAGRYDNGVIAPLIFTPIQDDGYMPDLEMSLDDFRKMLKK